MSLEFVTRRKASPTDQTDRYRWLTRESRHHGYCDLPLTDSRMVSHASGLQAFLLACVVMQATYQLYQKCQNCSIFLCGILLQSGRIQPADRSLEKNDVAKSLIRLVFTLDTAKTVNIPLLQSLSGGHVRSCSYARSRKRSFGMSGQRSVSIVAICSLRCSSAM